MNLVTYKNRKNIKRTVEPADEKKRDGIKRIFVVQRHQASTLHYDLRLEINGVLKSWAIPKGPSMNANDKRLAVMLEDRPVSYASFRGTVPGGNNGADVVDIWDKGTFMPNGSSPPNATDRQLLKQLKDGSFKFVLNGKRLKGTFRLLQLKERGDNLWLLIKGNDRYAVEHPYDSEDYRISHASSRDRIPLSPRP
jgi:bifunctional non-homologous end joining protein LigD